MARIPDGPSDAFLEELQQYAVRLAQPVFFGESPNNTYTAALSSGSGCFLLIDSHLIGVTCQHVLAGFRRCFEQGAAVFQFGPIRFNPEAHLLSESVGLDLATFDLTSFVNAPSNGVPRASCIEPTRWPPADVSADDVLALAGYPGIWRDQVNINHLKFYSFSSGATGVDASGEKHLVTRIQIEKCLVDIGHGLVLGSLGGLSGGPVFAWRKTPILVAELIGFITEYQETLDLMYIRRATVLSRSGHLVEQAV